MNNPGRIDEQARRQFESAWKMGEPATIAELLPDEDDPSHGPTLEELVHIDIEFRGSRQKHSPGGDYLLLPLTDYLEQFPQLADGEIILRLIQQEIHVRKACELPLDLEDYRRDFPDVVGTIQETDALLADSGAAFRSTAFHTEDSREAQTFIPATTDQLKSAMTVLPGIDVTSSLASIPERIGNYRLLRQLGAGGMGCVYEAEEIDSGQKVAVKIVLPELVTSDEAMERFRQEGLLASNISHPNCVFVLEADQQGDYPYIVMELVKGADLEDHVRDNGRLEVMDAIRKTVNIIEGLEEAHRLGVIHRDVKPSNCFLTGEGRLKIGDFGLSRTLAEDAQLTRSGGFIGTPLYASPEQIRNDQLDGRTDVYSVASTFYFMLAGQAPFHGSDPVSTMARIVADPAPPIREHCPELPRAIASVIHKGLQTDRKKRFQSMTDFRNALVQFLPEHRTPVGESFRFVAYLLDMAILFLCMLGLHKSLIVIDLETLSWSRQSTITWVLACQLVYFLYYVTLETLFGCTPGKWILGFRIRRITGEPMAFHRVLARTVILWIFHSANILMEFGITIIAPLGLWHAVFVFLPLDPHQDRLLIGLLALVSYFTLFIPLLTIRARNGYRGLHDLLSGSVVIKLPSRKTGKTRVVAVEDISTALPTITSRDFTMPTRLGAYRVEKPLRWKDNEMVLDAEDDRLDRNVWIHMRGAGSLTTSSARRDVDRRRRLRWLASGDHDGRPWDAYLAPEGMPLSRYLESQGRIDWLATREILESLATELEQAITEGTLSQRLSPQHLWVRPDGGVILLDFALHRDESIVSKVSHSADENGLALIAATAIYCLEGNCPTGIELGRRDSVDTVVDRAMPYGGRKLLARCLVQEDHCQGVDQFRQELEKTKNPELDIPRVTRVRRLVHLFAQGLLLAIPVLTFASGWGGTFGTRITTRISNQIKSIDRQLAMEASDFSSTTKSSLNQRKANLLKKLDEPIKYIGGFGKLLLSILWTPLVVLTWTFLTRGGYVFYGARIMIARKNGARASRILITGRALLAWLPFLAIICLGRLLYPQEIPYSAYFLLRNILMAVLVLYIVLALVFPRRGIHDVLAGTVLIPR